MQDLKAGQKVCFTGGIYSEYMILGHFLVLKDMLASDLAHIRMATKSQEHSESCPVLFGALVEMGVLEPIDVKEVNLG